MRVDARQPRCVRILHALCFILCVRCNAVAGRLLLDRLLWTDGSRGWERDGRRALTLVVQREGCMWLRPGQPGRVNGGPYSAGSLRADSFTDVQSFTYEGIFQHAHHCQGSLN
jgi:hypothetical protein